MIICAILAWVEFEHRNLVESPMDTEPITAARLAASVVAVPRLARRADFTIDRETE